ncbi:Protein of unknown function [Jatrophihabitans endophyticus]|uniref:DUF4232 domain-containing protein n=1 Tax=Jatrophihabitans endophyticus TaxID=1206085 RepID=A0A1M5KAA7_9ACTN|nr:DUF4232 domain-containing protein [Jatrophihabitans endophyticus]SHG49678.1 Protein of unknown function [Jatrophihabitans endophyticus]
MSDEPSPPGDIVECTPDEVDFSLSWRHDGDGALAGELVARNTGPRAWRLTGKPGLVLTDADGRDLAADHVVTLELRLPGYAVVAPGGVARAAVSLGRWDGTPLGPVVGVTWEGGRADVRPDGPPAPTAASGPTTTSSSWFTTG